MPLLLVSPLAADTSSMDDQTIQYQISETEFGVVVIQKDGMTQQEARKIAIQKAAETAQKYSYRYFVIESEGEVVATDTNQRQKAEQQMPRNMYYELFQSDNFGRYPMDQNTIPESSLYPGYRIVFKCTNSRPPAGGIDSCKVIECKPSQ